MPIRNYPFSIAGQANIAKPYLPVTIINPENGKRQKVYAIIDTGADECALPASYAAILGHNLQAGQDRQVNTCNGPTTVYSHTTSIEIKGFTTPDVLIDYMPNLSIPLLGVKSFLANFILTIDYPNKTFSLILP